MAQLIGVLCTPKGWGFDSWSGCIWEEADQCFSLSPLSLSLPLSKINERVLKIEKKNKQTWQDLKVDFCRDSERRGIYISERESARVCVHVCACVCVCVCVCVCMYLSNPHPRICLLIFREGGSGRERETLMWERETSISRLPFSPQLGMELTT